MRRIGQLIAYGTSYAWACTLLMVTVAGLLLSMVTAPSTDWVGWHLSRLGEGQSFAAAVFNFTLIAAAGMFAIIATRLFDEIDRVSRHSGAALVRTLFIATAISWVGIAIFPNDRFFIAHNIFGYSHFLLVSVLMLSLKKLCPAFSKRTYAIGYASALLVGLLLAHHHMAHLTTLLFVELTGQVMFYIWLLSLTHDHTRKGSRFVDQ